MTKWTCVNCGKKYKVNDENPMEDITKHYEICDDKSK
jgi:hypothetical protein